MRVLGIDPGLNTTGYGIIEENGHEIKVHEAGVVRTDVKAAIEDRLLDISRDIQNVIEQFKPDAIAIEELYSHYKHPRTAIIMGHARGIVFMKAAEAGVRVFPYSATKVKSSLTGNGRASKQQVQQMICSTLGMSALPEPPDVADALAVALCHIQAIRQRKAIRI
ncbi:MAG: crossover junction endodeoxyribonuclease RuvC [Candidatus Zixiibacteriota bacterium]|nr:MAG: crossover junction endodeoxyribonuclease RuvC [candidate division Zixibacteria bacterium]